MDFWQQIHEGQKILLNALQTLPIFQSKLLQCFVVVDNHCVPRCTYVVNLIQSWTKGSENWKSNWDWGKQRKKCCEKWLKSMEMNLMHFQVVTAFLCSSFVAMSAILEDQSLVFSYQSKQMFLFDASHKKQHGRSNLDKKTNWTDAFQKVTWLIDVFFYHVALRTVARNGISRAWE